MLRRILKVAAIGAVGLVLAGGVLYQFFGLRVVLDGGGTPHLRFVESAEAHADEIARNRHAASAQAEAAAPAPQPAAPALIGNTPPDASSEAVPSAPAPAATAAPAPYWTEFR